MPAAEVLAAYQAQQGAILEWVDQAVREAWAGLGTYDRADIAKWLDALQGIVPPAQSALAELTTGMVAAVTDSAAVAVPETVYTAVRSGVSFADEYQRPFLRLWHDLKATDTPFPDLVTSSGDYAAGMAHTDTQLAMTRTMQTVVEEDDKLIGYRRTLTGKSCRFCATASTQLYGQGRRSRRGGRLGLEWRNAKAKKGKAEYGPTSTLMPLHKHCDCGVAPVTSRFDPALDHNQSILRALQDGGGPDYWKSKGFVDTEGNPLAPTDLPKSLAAVEHNAEIGPVLKAA